MEHLDTLLQGRYCSADPGLPWDQRVDIHIWRNTQGQKERERWTLRYNDRKYQQSPTVTFELLVDGNGCAAFKAVTFPHWIMRREVVACGEFTIETNGTILLQFTQTGQGMTGLETWTCTLMRETNQDAKLGEQRIDANPTSAGFLKSILSNFSAPNSLPTQPRIDALAVAKNGVILLEEYLGDMTSTCPHIISSCTKSITSLLAGIAIDQGLFNLDDRIVDYFSGIPSTWGENPPVLIRHVLSMTAGTQHTPHDAQDLLESAEVERLVLGWKRFSIPGTRYNYDNGLPALIGCLIERRSGIPLDRFAATYLFQPLGVTDQTWTRMPLPSRRYGNDSPVLAAGGMSLTLPDFMKLGQMLLQMGQYEGRRIVSEAYILDATRQHTHLTDYPYGLYFHVNQRNCPDDTTKELEYIHLDGLDGYFALGQGEQILFVSPRRQLVAAVFSSTWHREAKEQTDRYAAMKCIGSIISELMANM